MAAKLKAMQATLDSVMLRTLPLATQLGTPSSSGSLTTTQGFSLSPEESVSSLQHPLSTVDPQLLESGATELDHLAASFRAEMGESKPGRCQLFSRFVAEGTLVKTC